VLDLGLARTVILCLNIMLVIRDAQMEVFRALAERNFEALAMEHLKSLFPSECAARGDDAVLESIRVGVNKARGYELATEIHLLRYLRVMFVLGDGFDEQSNWAREILTDPELSPETKSSELIYGVVSGQITPGR
jgi:hypothetical protein